ncbi:MAG: hypothetical protein LBV13_02535 [Methanomassiliicoccaceae archaeon]|jgi:DNA replication factor GINS|nr:hypothetical protein [Methanomassiliicoccaceae archaeon]
MMPQDTEPMTFDDLTSAYRAEMKKPLLADVRKDLYHALLDMQAGIQKEYEREYSSDPDSIMCEGINERRKKVNGLVQKVIDLRMEKVAMLALRASVGAKNTLESLTHEEKEYYDSITAESKRHRAAVIKEKKGYVIPDISPGNADKKGDVPFKADIGHEGEEMIESPHRNAEYKEDTIIIRILEDLPRIAGPDCDYDLKKEEVVRMPAALANALITHKKAVQLKVTP